MASFQYSIKPQLPANLYYGPIVHQLSNGLLRTYTENLQRVFQLSVYAPTVN